MRIAYVITRADAVGGASIHVRDLAREMRARGHEVRVFVGGAGPVTDQLSAAGVPFQSLAFLRRAIRPDRELRAFFELSSALGGFRPGLVSTHTAKAGWIGRAAAKRLGIPAIYTPHGLSVGERAAPGQSTVFTLAEQTAARWASAIVCVCEAERRLALARRIAEPGKLVVIHNGVGDVPLELRAAPAVSPVRIVSVARFEPPKDHATLLEALAALRGLEWGLDLVGDGPLESATRESAAALGIGDRVRFLGYRPDPAPWLARGQIFALSSRSEALPRSVLEAMRAGLPVVASRVGGVDEAVDNGENGVLVPPRDAGALSAALGELIEDASRRQLLGAAARLTYGARFRLEMMVERTAELYGTVLKRNAGN